MRILLNSVLALALAGFIIPSITSDADAGRRYKHSGKARASGYRQRSYRTRSHGNRSYRNRRYNSGGYLLRIPGTYLQNTHTHSDFSNRSYHGGPKIINVRKVLEDRRKRELLN